MFSLLHFSLDFTIINIVKYSCSIMSLRRSGAGMRESGENPEHRNGAVSAECASSRRKSVIGTQFLRRRGGTRNSRSRAATGGTIVHGSLRDAFPAA